MMHGYKNPRGRGGFHFLAHGLLSLAAKQILLSEGMIVKRFQLVANTACIATAHNAMVTMIFAKRF